MAGDLLRSDILGARDFGYRSALLLTGVTTLDMLERSEIRPDLVFETLG
jgi:4-nitrophenyl phosphatase